MEHLNLLPHERLLNLRREMSILALIWLMTSVMIGLIILTLIGVGVGASLWGLSLVETSSEDQFVARMAEYFVAREEIDQVNTLLRAVDDTGGSRVAWSPLIVSLLSVAPPGATIDTLTIDGEDNLISISGTAPTRASLVAFEDRLRELDWTKEVDAPRDNLLRRNNPSYTFSLYADSDKISVSDFNDGYTSQP
jgi:Tfp pilus assembly protein PilN